MARLGWVADVLSALGFVRQLYSVKGDGFLNTLVPLGHTQGDNYRLNSTDYL
jgi:hypothetical protein